MHSSTPPSRPEPDDGLGPWRVGVAVVATTAIVLGLVLTAVWIAADRGFLGGESEAPSPIDDLVTLRPGDPGTDVFERRLEADDECLPIEPEYEWPGFGYVDCDDQAAFYVVDAVSDDIDAIVDDEGRLVDQAVADRLCGRSYALPWPGAAWTHVLTYHSVDDRSVVIMGCIRALVRPDEDGRLPVMPTVGDCIDDSSRWWSVPCDYEHAIGRVVDVIITPDEPELTGAQVRALAAECVDGDSHQEVNGPNGTGYLLCYERF